ncbi:MAG: DNA ligase D [Candidatus Eisenbacteria bacterium]
MGLAAYRKRRRFDITPEPAGTRARKSKALGYVIQKHDASRLHYDFRLELDGTLKSWAVPKGPSMNPKDRRLAVEVEDHPVAYASFEGRIPKGQYGAGTVEIWDKGTWEPEGDPRAGLRKGSLHFALNGERLTGRWNLVRMDHRDEKAKTPQWLLMKSREKAAPAPTPRPSGRRPPPRFVPPQLATLVESVPEGEDWLHEIKFDGYRVQAHINHGKVVLHTRTGRDWTERFTEVAEALAKLDVTNALIDGEVAVTAADGVTHFQLLQNMLGSGEKNPLTYYVFDLLHLDGRDLRGESLESRKEALRGLLPKRPPKTAIVRFSDHIEGQGEAFHLAACRKGLEGIISKRRDGPYRAGRTREWVKSKCRMRQEFVIGGYTPPRGGREGFGALLLGARDDSGALVYTGRVGTGFNASMLRSLLSKLQRLERTRAPFADAPEERGLHWVEPKLVAEVSFANWTQDHLLRQAAFVGLRGDKRAGDIVIEKPAEAGRDHAHSEPDSVAGIRITHPARLAYAPERITKLELARYMESVSRWMLPHVIERPLMILRCPSGAGEPCFYQKNVATHASRFARGGAAKPSNAGAHVLVHDLADLIELVQNNALEIHTWSARQEDLEHPDRLVFDLDPHESVKWPRIIEVAREFKRRLEKFDLPVFVKTTGGRGLHVAVPLRPVHSWDQLRAAAERIAGEIVAGAPDRLTLQISKSKRTGKIFIDTLRNIRGATCVAPYSPRARARATISLPLPWSQLTAAHPPTRYTIKAWDKLSKRRTDPWRDWESARARLPAALTRAK